MHSFDEQAESVRASAIAVRPPESLGANVPPILSPASAPHLQRLAGNAAVSRLATDEEADGRPRSPVLDVIGRGGGSALAPEIRTDMESRLGHDFSDVRVHTDAGAAASATAVQAHAYTVGNEVVFNDGQFDPGSDAGRHTLAHELTHVVQQRSGPVDGTPTGGGIAVSDPSDRYEREAESNAHSAMAAEPVSAGVTAAPGAAVQREAAEEEKKEEDEPVAQGKFVQREAAEEEELQA